MNSRISKLFTVTEKTSFPLLKFDQVSRNTQMSPPLAHSADQMPLGCVGSHFHQAAAETAGVHPEWPFKVKDLAALAVEALQGAGASWATTLEAHTRAL